MYRDFFGLHDQPFRNTPDPEFFYFSGQHRQALTNVITGIQHLSGLVLLLGDVGTGKTTICSYVQSMDDYACAHLKNPFLTEVEFLETVNGELGVTVGEHSRKALTDALFNYLVRQYRRDKPVVLIVDEAHRLGLPVLDQILTLSNLQASEAQLLQIVLVGQPELQDTLCHPRLRSLNQRIGIRYHLRSMDRTDTVDYIDFRLKKAGRLRSSLFTSQALAMIYKASGGTPRLINQLCDRALNTAYQQGNKRVGRRLVKEVVEDPLYRSLFVSNRTSWVRRAALAGLFVAIVIGAVTGLWYVGSNTEFISAVRSKVGSVTLVGHGIVRDRATTPESSRGSGGESGVAELAANVSARPAEQFNKKTLVRFEPEISPANMPAGTVQGGYEAAKLGEGEDVQPVRQSLAAHTRPIPEPIEQRSVNRLQIEDSDALPDLKLSAIAWDQEPSRRIAVLNDGVVREGHFLGEVRVLRINPDHVVLLYGNIQVSKSIHTQEEHHHTPPSAGGDYDGEQNAASLTRTTGVDRAEPASSPDGVPTMIHFDYKDSEMALEAREELNRLVVFAEQNPHVEILVKGYTDDVGSKEYNRRLSKIRADRVRGYFLAKGINPRRVQASGRGRDGSPGAEYDLRRPSRQPQS